MIEWGKIRGVVLASEGDSHWRVLIAELCRVVRSGKLLWEPVPVTVYRNRVFRVRSKPSKQPLGLVVRGVPIEKVRAKRAMHSDWGGPTLDKALYLGFEVSPRNNSSDWSRMVFQ